MNNPIRYIVVASCAVSLAAFGDTNVNAVVANVRTAMAAYIQTDIPLEFQNSTFVRNSGLKSWQTPSFTNLSVAVSNSMDIVMDNVDACATNQFEKYVLMGTGWIFGDDYYLTMFDKILDAVGEGQLTLDDARWYNAGHHSNFKLNTLARKFDTQIVSNIVDKIEGAGGDTNYCCRIRTGEAKREYDEFELEMGVKR